MHSSKSFTYVFSDSSSSVSRKLRCSIACAAAAGSGSGGWSAGAEDSSQLEVVEEEGAARKISEAIN